MLSNKSVLCSALLVIVSIYGACALRERFPETPEEFQKALDEAKPGDVISLKPIDYVGDFYIETSGDAYHKIQVQGAHTDDSVKATRLIGNKTALEIRGNYWAFKHLNITADEEGVYLEGSNNTLESFAIYHAKQAMVVQGTKNTLGSISINDVLDGILLKGSDNRIRDIALNNCTSGLIVESGDRNRIHNLDLHNAVGKTLALSLGEGTCCGRVTNTVFDGLVEIRGNQYNFRNTIANSAINILGCRNEFGRSVFSRTFFTKECENKLVTSNVFHFPQEKPITLESLEKLKDERKYAQDIRDQELEQRGNAIDKRIMETDKLLKERESGIAAREQAVIERESQVIKSAEDREQELERLAREREADAGVREKGLEDRETAVAERENKVEERETRLAKGKENTTARPLRLRQRN